MCKFSIVIHSTVADVFQPLDHLQSDASCVAENYRLPIAYMALKSRNVCNIIVPNIDEGCREGSGGIACIIQCKQEMSQNHNEYRE